MTVPGASSRYVNGRLRFHGVSVDEMDPPEGWGRLLLAARTVNAYEGARSHSERHREFGDRIGVRLAELVRNGLAIPDEEYQAHIARMRGTVAQILWEYPVILTPAAAGAAPKASHPPPTRPTTPQRRLSAFPRSPSR